MNIIEQYKQGNRDFTGAYLGGANLSGATLSGANLQVTNLQGSDLRGAYLRGAYLQGAYLQGAYGITAFYGVGESRRFGFVYKYKGVYHIQLGCYNSTLDEMIEKIKDKYSDGAMRDAYIAIISASTAVLKTQYGDNQ